MGKQEWCEKTYFSLYSVYLLNFFFPCIILYDRRVGKGV